MTDREREWQDAIDRQATLVLQSATNLKRIADGIEWMRFPARMDLRRAERQVSAAQAILREAIAREDARLEKEKLAI